MKSSNPLQRLAAIQDAVASLKAEAHQILDSIRSWMDGAIFNSAATGGPAKRGRKPGSTAAAPKAAKAAKPDGRKTRGSSPLKGKKRPASPSGPLAPAVVDLITKSGKPLSVSEIYEGLSASGYVFTAKDPKTNLSARVYKLPGVVKVGTGMFGLG